MAIDRRHAVWRAAYWLTLAAAVAPLISIAASHVLLAASLIAILLSRERLRLPPVKLPLALFIVGTLLSLFLSGHIAAGLPQVKKFYVVLLTLVSISTVFRKAADGISLALWWVAAATCDAGFGLIQFGQHLLAARRSGGSMYLELVGHRITGFTNLWMTFSGELMIVLMMLTALLMFSEAGRRHWKLLVVCGVGIGTALLLALTRGPWIGAAAGFVYLLWKWNRKSLFALPVILVLGFVFAPATLRERVASIQQPRTYMDSNQHRLVLWRTGLEMIKAHPWFGVGPEQVQAQFERYVPASIPRPLPWGWYGHMHNIYLQYAAERGIPVLLVFLWLVGKVLWDFRRIIAGQSTGLSDPKAILHGCVAGIIAVLAAGFFEHNLGDSEVLQLFLSLIAIGYAAAGGKQARPAT